MEQWKPVVGYEDHYSISNLGNVMRTKQWSGARPDRPVKQNRILKPALMNSGYKFVVLCVNGKTKIASIHRTVAAAFIGPCPEGLQVNHKDGNKLNNDVANLEYVSRSQNVQHAMDNIPRKPTSLRGQMVPNAKLTEADVRKIKKRLANGEPQKRIAEDYGVVRQVIHGIAKGKGWKWVT